MLKFSACIEAIFQQEPFLERIDALAATGIRAFEFWRWQTKDLAGISARRERYGLEVAAFIGGSGLTDPARRSDFVRDIEASLAVAQKLDCSRLIVTSGNAMPGMARETQHENIVNCLLDAAPLAESARITLLLEPLNVLVDHPGNFLTTSAEALAIIREVGSPAVKLLYDIYHQQISEGNLTATIRANIGAIGHFHCADVPGRHEPGTGEINYVNILGQIAALGYQGYVGLEYFPLAPPLETLRNLAALASV